MVAPLLVFVCLNQEKRTESERLKSIRKEITNMETEDHIENYTEDQIILDIEKTLAVEKALAAQGQAFKYALELLIRVYKEGYVEQAPDGEEGDILEGTIIPDDLYDEIGEFIQSFAE